MSKPIIETTHDRAANLRPVYSYYSRDDVARTESRDPEGSVNIDLDTNGEAIGDRDPQPGRPLIGLALEAARQYGLSLTVEDLGTS